MSKNYGLNGVGQGLEFEKGGPVIQRVLGTDYFIVKDKESLGSETNVRLATPASPDPMDAVNVDYLERYVATNGAVAVTGEIDGSGVIPVVVAKAVYVCTTTGGGYTKNYLYRGEGAAWVEIIPSEGLAIVVTDALTGFDADSVYVWDADGTPSWLKIGPATSITNVQKTLRSRVIAVADAGTPVVLGTLPIGAILTRVTVIPGPAFTAVGTSDITVESDGSLGEIMPVDFSDLVFPNGPYILDRYEAPIVAAQEITATLNALATGAAGRVWVLVEYTTA